MGMNTRKIKSLSILIGVAIAVSILAVYLAVIRSMINDSPVALVACMEVEGPWRASTCEQVLRHASLTED
jgi:predicted membrane protein